MKYHKFIGTYRGLTGVAQRVYDCVPISEAWQPQQIKAELTCQGRGGEVRIIMGCLNALIDSGLVKEVPKGYFQRIPVDPKPANTEKTEETEEAEKEEVMTATLQTKLQPKLQTKKDETAPIDKIAKLASRCIELSVMLQKLASDVETVAIEVQNDFAQQGEDAQKLKQLQALLKSTIG